MDDSTAIPGGSNGARNGICGEDDTSNSPVEIAEGSIKGSDFMDFIASKEETPPKASRPKPNQPPVLAKMPFDIMLEILKNCDVSSFINLLSTCRDFRQFWSAPFAKHCFYQAIKNEMTPEAWIVYRMLKARKWETEGRPNEVMRIRDKYRGKKGLLPSDGPLHALWGYSYLGSWLGNAFADNNKDLGQLQNNINAEISLLKHGFEIREEKRGTIMKELFFMQATAQYWTNRFREDVDFFIGTGGPYVQKLSTERLTKGFYAAWLASLQLFERPFSQICTDDNPSTAASKWQEMASVYALQLAKEDPQLIRDKAVMQDFLRYQVSIPSRNVLRNRNIRSARKSGKPYPPYTLIGKSTCELVFQHPIFFASCGEEEFTFCDETTGNEIWYWEKYISMLSASDEYFDRVDDLSLDFEKDEPLKGKVTQSEANTQVDGDGN